MKSIGARARVNRRAGLRVTPHVFDAAAADAEALAERMLAALGGRAAWAATTNTVNDSQQNWDGEPPLLRVVITMDFERPRLRIETRGEKRARRPGDRRRTPLADDARRNDCAGVGGNARDRSPLVPGARLQDAASHREARSGDPDLGRQGATGSRCTKATARIAWYALDRSDQPYSYGAHDDDTGSIFGPWEAQGTAIKHPVWVSRDDGKWRAMLKRLDVNVAARREAVRAAALAPIAADHRQVELVLARAGDRLLVPGIRMSHDAGRGIVPQHALDAAWPRRPCRRTRSRRLRAASSPCRRRRRDGSRPRSRRLRCSAAR